jgi:putative sterol carrier protein
VAEPLTSAWVSALAAAAQGATAPAGIELVVQQIVVDAAGGEELAYAVRIGGGTVAVTEGRADDADVTFTQDRDTAVAIAAGELSAQAAFLAGRLRVGGDLRAALDNARELAALGDVFASARA